ncbi:MAG TPA: helix-turn-helix domain-containing protein [Microthrixaceae bacterium]|nr:helix-turn-helix domain-containing protein [Microthrixaceae bacterium]
MLAAASELFGERGFHAVSVAEIAEAAGYTIGALYANFANKDALFLAVIDRRVGEHLAALLDAYRSGATPEAGLAAIADLFEERLTTMFDWNLALIEFTVRSRHDANLRSELGSRHAAARAGFAEAIRTISEERGNTLPTSAEVIASALLGSGTGLTLEHLVDSGAPTAAAYRHTLFQTLGITDPQSSIPMP